MQEALKLDLFEGEYHIPEKDSSFKINTIETANWAFRKLRQLNKQKLDNKVIADQERERISHELSIINEWESKKNEPIDNSIEYFMFLLKQFLSELRRTDPKAKIDTPFGSVSTKKSSAKYEYTDDLAITWFKDNDLLDFIRTKEELNKQGLKSDKRFKEFEGQLIDSQTGEVIPGIAISYPADETIVKVVD